MWLGVKGREIGTILDHLRVVCLQLCQKYLQTPAQRWKSDGIYLINLSFCLGEFLNVIIIPLVMVRSNLPWYRAGNETSERQFVVPWSLKKL